MSEPNFTKVGHDAGQRLERPMNIADIDNVALLRNVECLEVDCEWLRGVAVKCRTCDQEVAHSSLGRAPWRKNSGQVSHTYVPLSTSSIIWYRRKLGSKQAPRAIRRGLAA